MAYERNDRDFPSRDRDDDQQRLTGRWVQDDETGHLRRRFDDDGRNDEADRGDRGGREHDDRRSWDNSGGGYYGQSNRRSDGNGGHAFDFARRDSGRSDLGGDRYRSFEGQNRFNSREDYPRRSGGAFDRSHDYGRQDSSSGSPRGEWPEKGNWISRYVAAEGRADGRSAAGAGSFRGKGPKGYVRSDERIKDDVSDRLSDDDTLDATDITVEVASGEVTLSGYVDSRQAKHTAEDCAEQCGGVTHVQNNLRVRSASDRNQAQESIGTESFSDGSKTTNL